MPPKLTKAEQEQLTRKQPGKIQRSAAKAEEATDRVQALKSKRDAQRDSISSLKDGLGSLEEKLANHPLTQKVKAKKDEISIARSDLQSIVVELEEAKDRLQKALGQRDDVITSVKKELEPYEETDDSDEDD